MRHVGYDVGHLVHHATETFLRERSGLVVTLVLVGFWSRYAVGAVVRAIHKLVLVVLFYSSPAPTDR